MCPCDESGRCTQAAAMRTGRELAPMNRAFLKTSVMLRLAQAQPYPDDGSRIDARWLLLAETAFIVL